MPEKVMANYMTHGEESKTGKLYLGMANMIEVRLSEESQ